MTTVRVVCFSRSGATAQLARQLAERLEADFETVKSATNYGGVVGYWRGIWHSLRRHNPEISYRHNPADYDFVIIATPIWVGGLSAPIRAYLSRSGLRRCALLYVSGSGLRFAAVAEEVERLTGHAPVATAHFSAREVGSSTAALKLDALAQAVRARVS